MNAHDWLKVGSMDPQANSFSGGAWWAWKHRNLMCLNNKTFVPKSAILQHPKHGQDFHFVYLL
jgi:hypothetical protein